MGFSRGDCVRICNIENTSNRIQCSATQKRMLWLPGVIVGSPQCEFFTVKHKLSVLYVWHESSLEIDLVKLHF